MLSLVNLLMIQRKVLFQVVFCLFEFCTLKDIVMLHIYKYCIQEKWSNFGFYFRLKSYSNFERIPINVAVFKM